VKEIEKLALASWHSKETWSNHSDRAHVEGFICGFIKARELACDLWEHKYYHVYCDFYGTGSTTLRSLGEQDDGL
jgi:hypothetical protein